MRFIVVFLILLSYNTVHGQSVFDTSKVRKSLLALTKQIPEYRDTIGYLDFHNDLDYLHRYDTIFKKATDNELYELTNHPNPLVRRSSLYSLLDRHSMKVLNLLQKNANDTVQYFNIQYGCFLERVTFVDELLFYLSPRSGWDRHFKMTVSQKKTITAMFERREKDKRQLLDVEQEKELQEYIKNHKN